MHASLRELAQRKNDGLEVILFWDARSNEVSVAVNDQRAESSFQFAVAGDCALDAFHHPYAYAVAS